MIISVKVRSTLGFISMDTQMKRYFAFWMCFDATNSKGSISLACIQVWPGLVSLLLCTGYENF